MEDLYLSNILSKVFLLLLKDSQTLPTSDNYRISKNTYEFC